MPTDIRRSPLTQGSLTRRTFLTHSAMLTAGATLVSPGQLFAGIADRRKPVSDNFVYAQEVIGAEELRRLALVAIETARSAGAEYTDVRIAARRDFFIGMNTAGYPPPSGRVLMDVAYGIRARVGGVTAFVGGAVPTTDGVSLAARNAVSTACGLSTVVPLRPAWIAVPVVQGEWRTPTPAIDPFSISPDEHVAILAANLEAMLHVPNTTGDLNVQWSAETRIVATSEGTLVTQHRLRSRHGGKVDVGDNYHAPFGRPVSWLSTVPVGVESLMGAAAQDRMIAFAEDVRRIMMMPIAPVEVGRTPAILSGEMVGALANETLLPALVLDRALGTEVDVSGSSPLAPPETVLGVPLMSPVLNLTSDQRVSSDGQTQWDDEGVATAPFPLIERGAVVNYFSTRASAPALAAWANRRNMPLSTYGSTSTTWPAYAPVATASGVRIDSGQPGSTIDAMVSGMNNGILMYGPGNIQSDFGLSGGLCMPNLMLEVKRGVVTRRLVGGLFAFRTLQLWKGVRQLGAESTREYTSTVTGAVSAPAVMTPSVDIISIPRPTY